MEICVNNDRVKGLRESCTSTIPMPDFISHCPYCTVWESRGPWSIMFQGILQRHFNANSKGSIFFLVYCTFPSALKECVQENKVWQEH